MNVQALKSPGWSWFRLWVRPRPGIAAAEIQQLLQAAFTDRHREEVRSFPPDTPSQRIEAHLTKGFFSSVRHRVLPAFRETSVVRSGSSPHWPSLSF